MEVNNEIEIEEEAHTTRFNERIKKAQRFYYLRNWRAFKEIFEQEKKDLLKDFDLFRNTAIIVATRSNIPILLKDLLEMLPQEDRWLALRRKNGQQNTLLHEIASREAVEMVDVVLEFEKNNVAALPEEEEVERRMPPLMEIKNQKGETPLFRAAKFGNLKMVIKMAKYVGIGSDNMEVHFFSKSRNILHACVIGQHFEIALWIMRRIDYNNTLAIEKDKNGLTCLQILSRMPDAFRSPHSMGCLKRLLYYLLPEEKNDEIQGQTTFEFSQQKRDLESGQQEDANKPPTSGLSRVKYTFWKYLAKVLKGIDNLWEKKKKQKLAQRLAALLVKNDKSWQINSHNDLITKTTVKLPPVLYNVSKRKKKFELEKKREQRLEDIRSSSSDHITKEEDDDDDEHNNGKEKYRYYNYSPLLVAASYGIEEMVELFLEEQPECINHVSEDGQNLVHMAVKHRQLRIFNLLKKNPEFEFLASQISSRTKRTILHHVARMDFYRPPELPGAAFQLQAELKWFKRVEKIIPKNLIMHCDHDYLTAGDILDIMHDDMLRDAQSWIKDTSQSCSTVSVLVATVVFAAAYTIPGGFEKGTAALLHSPTFLFFTTMDIVALALSLASVVMFLSILTSPFELWDFHKSLPTRLKIGFAFLFGSLTTTMLAFIATILLTVGLQWKQWSSTLIYGASFFPVTIFALIEFPLYMRLPSLLVNMCRKLMKMVRRCYSKRDDETKYP